MYLLFVLHNIVRMSKRVITLPVSAIVFFNKKSTEITTTQTSYNKVQRLLKELFLVAT
jgi:hypothetical protein